MDHYPQMKGVLFDRPGVADSADVACDKARVATIAGSFFDAEGMADTRFKACDVFMLKHIIHDWDDASSVAILKIVKGAAKPGAKIIVVEHGELSHEPEHRSRRTRVAVRSRVAGCTVCQPVLYPGVQSLWGLIGLVPNSRSAL